MNRYANEDLKRLIDLKGIKSIEELSIKAGVCKRSIKSYLTLINFRSRTDRNNTQVNKLAFFFGVPVESLFPVDIFYSSIIDGDNIIPIDDVDEELPCDSWESDPFLSYIEAIKLPIETILSLSSDGDVYRRNHKIAVARLIDGTPYKDLAKEFDLTTSRTRQICETRLRRLRHPQLRCTLYRKMGVAGYLMDTGTWGDHHEGTYFTSLMDDSPLFKSSQQYLLKEEAKKTKQEALEVEKTRKAQFKSIELIKDSYERFDPDDKELYADNETIMDAMPLASCFPFPTGYLLWNGVQWVNISGSYAWPVVGLLMPEKNKTMNIKRDHLISLQELREFHKTTK
jgi:hypothetical protein